MVRRNITTGVDRLVELVSEKKRLDLDVAAKTLGVGKNVVLEWATFLEEEGLVTLEYNLSKIFAIERKIGKEDVLTNVKEVASEKDALSRKIDVAINSLKEETTDFESIRSEFLNIQEHIKEEIDVVKKQLLELDRYDSLRKNLGKDIDKQKSDYLAFTKDAQEKLKSETQKYEEFKKVIVKEKENIDQYGKKIEDLIKLRSDYERTISSLKESLKNIDKVVYDYKQRFDDANKSVNKYKNYLDALENEISENKSSLLTKRIDALKANEDKLLKTQLQIEKEINNNITNVKSHAGLSDKVHNSFEGFFSKNISTEKLISEIESDKLSLTKDLEALKTKVISFTLLTSNAHIQSELKDIERQIKIYETKKMSIKSKIEQLISLFKKNK
jgi:DNA repair exonuclease SbcCD ATPase subunit